MGLIERGECLMRHENGNCTVAGGFCTAVNDPICDALHNAYDCGFRSACDRFRAADTVPVIRCAACKYTFVVTDQDGGRHLCCFMHGRRDLKEDDFCSYAELRK